MKVRFTLKREVTQYGQVKRRTAPQTFTGERREDAEYGFIYWLNDSHYYAESQVSSWQEI